MTSSLDQARRSQLDAFIVRVMDPLTDGELIDTRYNSLVRQSRHAAWNLADRVTEYYDGLRKAASFAESERGIGPYLFPGCTLPPNDKAIQAWRGALARQLLTPAPQKADIDWKKRQDLDYLPVSPEEVARAIAADEAFLAAHPVRVPKRRAAR